MTICAVPGRKHESDDGLHLCRNHLDELASWLHSIEEEVGLLDAAPSLAANWNGSRGGTLASHQTSARIAALVQADPRRVPLRDLTGIDGQDSTLSAFDTLHRWATEIRDGRELVIPGHWVTEHVLPGPVCRACTHSSCARLVSRFYARDPLSVTTERILLSRHLEWAAAQPWIGSLWAEIRRLRNQLQAVNGTGELRVGACPDCGGRLQVIRPHTSGHGSSGVWAVECDRDVLHRWEGKQLIGLRLLEDPKRKN